MLRESQRNIPIRDINPINHPTHVSLPPRSGYARFIELPLIDAVRLLTERGIKTVACSANELDVGQDGYLTIDYDTLSEANRAVAQTLVARGEARCSSRLGPTVLIIEFAISEGATVGAVRDWIFERAARFHAQGSSNVGHCTEA